MPTMISVVKKKSQNSFVSSVLANKQDTKDASECCRYVFLPSPSLQCATHISVVGTRRRRPVKKQHTFTLPGVPHRFKRKNGDVDTFLFLSIYLDQCASATSHTSYRVSVNYSKIKKERTILQCNLPVICLWCSMFDTLYWLCFEGTLAAGV